MLQRLEFPLVERVALQAHQNVVVFSVLLGWLKNLREKSLKRVSVIAFAVPNHGEAFRAALRSQIVESVTFSSSGVVEDLEMDVGFSSDKEQYFETQSPVNKPCSCFLHQVAEKRIQLTSPYAFRNNRLSRMTYHFAALSVYALCALILRSSLCP